MGEETWGKLFRAQKLVHKSIQQQKTQPLQWLFLHQKMLSNARWGLCRNNSISHWLAATDAMLRFNRTHSSNRFLCF